MPAALDRRRRRCLLGFPFALLCSGVPPPHRRAHARLRACPPHSPYTAKADSGSDAERQRSNQPISGRDDDGALLRCHGKACHLTYLPTLYLYSSVLWRPILSTAPPSQMAILTMPLLLACWAHAAALIDIVASFGRCTMCPKTQPSQTLLPACRGNLPLGPTLAVDSLIACATPSESLGASTTILPLL